jgi:hypothetical protein
MVYAVIKWSMTPFRFLYIQKHSVNILLTNAMLLSNDKAVEKKYEQNDEQCRNRLFPII